MTLAWWQDSSICWWNSYELIRVQSKVRDSDTINKVDGVNHTFTTHNKMKKIRKQLLGKHKQDSPRRRLQGVCTATKRQWQGHPSSWLAYTCDPNVTGPPPSGSRGTLCRRQSTTVYICIYMGTEWMVVSYISCHMYASVYMQSECDRIPPFKSF